MKKILIVGLGLIGGSIALGIRRGQSDWRILGSDRPETLAIAIENRVVDEAVENFELAAPEADVILLAVPIDSVIDYIGRLSNLNLKPDVIITDTGSTKARIVGHAQHAFTNQPVRFIGGHPMAGSHKSGIRAADVNLFENAYYVLTEDCPELEELLSGLHARFIILDSREHDEITGQVSHFPHVLASSLVQQSESYAQQHPLVRRLAAGGFRDLTRIAETDSSLWTAVLLSNPTAILERIEDFKGQLDAISRLISQSDEEGIRAFFERGKAIRQGMEIHKGALPNFYDLYLSIPDEKGATARILMLLQDISITSLKIHEENREDIHGVLQISFRTEADRAQARKLLVATGDYGLDL